MRVIHTWYLALIKQVKPHWVTGLEMRPSHFCSVELGLFFMEQVLPNEPIGSLWAVLTGYPYPQISAAYLNQMQRQIVRSIRYYLPFYRNRTVWNKALKLYMAIPAQLRGYQLDLSDQSLVRRQPAIAVDRWTIYQATLNKLPNYRQAAIKWASHGHYRFAHYQRQIALEIPADLALPSLPRPQQLPQRLANPPIQVTWQELERTAKWMDERLGSLQQQHFTRIQRVRLEIIDRSKTKLEASTTLTLEAITHLVGMVSAGKSTLMEVLAVLVVHQNPQHHVTLVLGDVINVLNTAQMFDRLDIKVAPILGNSNRENHLHKLHQTQAQQANPFQHKGFEWLSTSCLLDGLINHEQPIGIQRRPCLGLEPIRQTAQTDQTDEVINPPNKEVCPFFSKCSYHQAQRDLLTAQIWIATPASLVFSQFSPQIMPERVRFAELVVRRSNLIIIDEADRVQVQLDSMFSPSQNLISRSNDAWLNQLDQHLSRQMHSNGRSQLANPQVAQWCQAHDLVQIAANRVYSIILQSGSLQKRLRSGYFTAWSLFQDLLSKLALDSADTEKLEQIFEKALDDPFGEQTKHSLVAIIQACLTLTEASLIDQLLSEWLNQQAPDHQLNQVQYFDSIKLFDLSLMLLVLSHKLHFLIREWQHVETDLALDQTNPDIFHRPPDDYLPELPTAPMGNILAFQYLQSSSNSSGRNITLFSLYGNWPLAFITF